VEIISFLGAHGIEATECGPCIAVNRDSMCCSKFSRPGIPEETIYPAVLEAIMERFGTDDHLFWCGKTDDDLFLGSM
jgi:hypothetical protein